MIFPSTLYSRLVIAYNGVKGPEYFQAGDSLMKPGMVCTHDDADEVKVCLSTTKPFGIVGCDADHDLSTVYAEGERIPIWVLGCGVDIYVKCADSSTITVEKHDIIETADTTWKGDGKVKEDFLIASTTNYLGTAAAERNIGIGFYIGRALAGGSITATVERYVPVKLSL